MQQESRPVWQTFLRENWLYLLVLAFLIVFPHLVGWLTDSSPFGIQRGSRVVMRGEAAVWMAIVIEMFALAILVMSYNLMFGFTGVLSLGHALFFGIGGYTVGLMVQESGLNANLSLLIGCVLTLVITGIVGFLMGLVSLRLRGIYFAIFTLAVAEMGWIWVGRWPLTNGEDGFTLSELPTWIDPSSSRINLYYVGLIAFVLTFLFIRRLVNSPTGRVFQAIRENEERAKAIGFNTLYYKLFSITVASMMAGGAGVLHGLLNEKLGPEMFSVVFTVDALLMTIIGGIGTFTGPVLGAGGLYLADSLLRDAVITIGETTISISDSWTLILGLIFVVVVLVFPLGIVGTWRKFWMSRRARKRREDASQRDTAPATGD